MDINEYVLSFKRNDYQRDNFDDFLHAVKFTYRVPSVHIAGTNGKGSTAIYIANIYRKAGYKVGLFQSPFFYSYHEMITINGKEITDSEIEEIVNPVKKLIEKNDLSSFEIQAYVALEYFKKQNVDVAIIECGMGGELDATNIFTPILSIITSVSLEHTSFLGKSISEIAEQKGGIIKPEIPVLLGELPEDAVNTVSKICSETKSKIFAVGKYAFESLKSDGFEFTYLTYKNLKIKSRALYSVNDACLAIDAVRLLVEKLPISDKDIYDGLADISIPFRMERVMDRPEIIIDGAHNPEAMEKLAKCMEIYAENRQIHVIFACFRDKNIQRMLESLSILSNDVSLTTFDHPRARVEEEYFLFGADYQFENDYVALINRKLQEYPDDIFLITGSLAFVSFIKKDISNKIIHYEKASI